MDGMCGHRLAPRWGCRGLTDWIGILLKMSCMADGTGCNSAHRPRFVQHCQVPHSIATRLAWPHKACGCSARQCDYWSHTLAI